MTLYCLFAQCNRWNLQSRPAQVMKYERDIKNTFPSLSPHFHAKLQTRMYLQHVFWPNMKNHSKLFLQFIKGERFKLFIVGFVLMQ